jgi:hypothetical protein
MSRRCSSVLWAGLSNSNGCCQSYSNRVERSEWLGFLAISGSGKWEKIGKLRKSLERMKFN